MSKQYEALEMIKEFLNSVITDKEDLSYKNPEQYAIGRLNEINTLADQLLHKIVDMNVFSTQSFANDKLYYFITEIECTQHERLDLFKTSTDFINAIDIINDNSTKNLEEVEVLLAILKHDPNPVKNKI